jgi:hypothetical protein
VSIATTCSTVGISWNARVITSSSVTLLHNIRLNACWKSQKHLTMITQVGLGGRLTRGKIRMWPLQKHVPHWCLRNAHQTTSLMKLLNSTRHLDACAALQSPRLTQKTSEA